MHLWLYIFVQNAFKLSLVLSDRAQQFAHNIIELHATAILILNSGMTFLINQIRTASLQILIVTWLQETSKVDLATVNLWRII